MLMILSIFVMFWYVEMELIIVHQNPAPVALHRMYRYDILMVKRYSGREGSDFLYVQQITRLTADNSVELARFLRAFLLRKRFVLHGVNLLFAKKDAHEVRNNFMCVLAPVFSFGSDKTGYHPRRSEKQYSLQIQAVFRPDQLLVLPWLPAVAVAARVARPAGVRQLQQYVR